MKKLLSLILLAAMAVGVLAGCAGRAGGENGSGESAGGELVGTWFFDYGLNNGSGETMTVGSDGRLTISFFGSGETVNVEGTYTVSGDVLSVSFNTGNTAEYIYKLEGNVLTFWIDGANGREKYRTYAAVIDGGNGSYGSLYSPGSYSDRGGPESDSGPKKESPVRTGLADKWYAAWGGTLVINEDGTGSKDGEKFTYTVTGDEIEAVSGGETVFGCSYILEGDFLCLYTPASEDIGYYYRASSVEPPKNKIVGCWKNLHEGPYGYYYMAFTNNDACLISNENGTYTYKTDGSTYKVRLDLNDEMTLRVEGNVLYIFDQNDRTCKFYHRIGTKMPDVSPGKLTGTWNSPDGYSIVFGIDENNSYDYGYVTDVNKNFIPYDYVDDWDNISIEVCGDIITLIEDLGDYLLSYRFKLDGNALTLYNLDGSLAGTFTKA